MKYSSEQVNAHLSAMCNEWFSSSYSLENARKHVSVRVDPISSEEIRKKVGEHDEEFTPLMLFTLVPIYDGYEIDYDVHINENLRENLVLECMFIGISLSYLSSNSLISLEWSKGYPMDYLSNDLFNDLCDKIKGFYYSEYKARYK